MKSIELPKFNHPEVEVFYHHDLSISKLKVEEVLKLPRATLIEDMVTLIEDWLERDAYFRSLENEEEWWSFQFHSIWVLCELKAVEALPTLKQLLKQNDDFYWYWYVDYLTEDLWEIYYQLANDRTEELKEIIFSSGDSFARGIATAVMEQIFFHQPTRKEEVIDWYREVLEVFLVMDDKDEAMDGEVISTVVTDLVSMQAKELLPQIKALYEQERIYDGFAGDINEIEQEIINPTYTRDRKRELKNSIFDRYESAMNWHGYAMKYDEEYREKHTPKPQKKDYDFRPIQSIPSTPKKVGTIKREGKKIGRNDPCPCGSGKKYKKCCLRK